MFEDKDIGKCKLDLIKINNSLNLYPTTSTYTQFYANHYNHEANFLAIFYAILIESKKPRDLDSNENNILRSVKIRHWVMRIFTIKDAAKYDCLRR